MKIYNVCNSCLTAALLFAATATMRAQGTNAPAPNATMQPHVRPLPPGGAAPGARRGLQEILSPEQWTSFEKVRATQSQKIMELRPKFMAAQREVFEAGLSPKFDEALVQQKAQAVAQLYAEMMVTQAKAFSEIQPPLSAEQIEQIKELQSPSPNARVVRPQPAPGAATNHNPNGLPPKQ